MVFVRSPLFSPPFTRLCIGIYTMREQRIRRTKDNRKRREQKRDDIQVISSDKEREASRDRDDLEKSLDHPLTRGDRRKCIFRSRTELGPKKRTDT